MPRASAFCSRPTSASRSRQSTPRRRRCAIPNTTSTISNLPDITEVWRRGSVIASWLLDLTAAALIEDPELVEVRRARLGFGRGPLDDQSGDRRSGSGAGAHARRSTSASLRAAKPISKTSCSRRCASSSAGTWSRNERQQRLRRARLLRRDRRPRVQEDLPGAAGDGQARQPRRAGHRRRQGRLEPRSAQSARARQHREARRHRRRRVRQALRLAALRRRRLRRPGDLRRSSRRSSATPSVPRTTWPFRRCCSRRSSSSWRSSGCAHGARVIVEKPFGEDLESAQQLNARAAPRSSTSRRSSASTTFSASGRCTT